MFKTFIEHRLGSIPMVLSSTRRKYQCASSTRYVSMNLSGWPGIDLSSREALADPQGGPLRTQDGKQAAHQRQHLPIALLARGLADVPDEGCASSQRPPSRRSRPLHRAASGVWPVPGRRKATAMPVRCGSRSRSACVRGPTSSPRRPVRRPVRYPRWASGQSARWAKIKPRCRRAARFCAASGQVLAKDGLNRLSGTELRRSRITRPPNCTHFFIACSTGNLWLPGPRAPVCRERWTDEDRRLYQRHRWRSEGYHGEAKTWHGLARRARKSAG